MMMMDGQDYVTHGERFYHKNHFFSGRIDYQTSIDQYPHFEIYLNEELNRFTERSSFYVNGRIRLLDADGRVLVDSDLPQPITRISIADKSDEKGVKFTSPGGQVNVKLYEVAETVGIRVSDTGIGIPEDDLPHLFSRFHRGRNAAAYPGSGLGLAIVKTIVDQHGACSADNTFTVRIKFSINFSHIHFTIIT